MAPSPTIRRLLRETAELSSSAPNPSPAFHAAPVSDSDLHEWHFTLLGPPAPSPYEGGLYHGRITLPPTYPLKPPNFRFLTPSGRFEVNREICLSISGFHEETWMPAWGVRTALTALRTFMAEAGTAGQVGGLEAPAEVRRRLARESREWRCGTGCEGKRNIEIMREWWGICREKGVKVDEEGAGQGTEMEVLPKGMNLEARSKDETTLQQQAASAADLQPKPHPEPTEQTAAQTFHQPPPTSPQAPPANQQSAPPSTSWSNLRTNSSSRISTSPIPHTATPTPESAQAHAESYLSTSELNASTNTPAARQRRPMMNVHAPPLAAASAALHDHAALQTTSAQHESQREHPQSNTASRGGDVSNTTGIAGARTTQPPTLTIDRAIAGVFLMLILMLLKKIFYPAGSGALSELTGFIGGHAGGGAAAGMEAARGVGGAGERGGGGGGFYMEREM